MLHLRCRASALLSLSLFAACSDDPVTQPPPGTNKDASVSNADAGSMGNADASSMGNPDGSSMGNPDASSMGNPDAMTNPGACNPITGAGCMGMGETCYYVQNPPPTANALVCRMPIGMTLSTNEQNCRLGQQDCAIGHHCVAFQGVNMDMPFCLKGCATDNDCAGVMGVGMNGYACALDPGDGLAKFCVPRAMGCNIDDPSTCPNDQTCEITATGPGCVPAGMVQKGAACMPGQCAHGLACLNFGNGGRCEELCNPATAGSCSGMGEVCAGFSVPNVPGDFGACQPGCDVYTQMCPNNGNCTLVSQTAVGCVPSGQVPPGGTCGAMAPCAQGGHCLDLGMGFRCFTACDMTHPCPTMGATCQMTNPALPWGGICSQ